MSSYRALTNFSYPEDIDARNRIHHFHRVVRGVEQNVGVPYPGDRGLIIEVVTGQILIDPPSDPLDNWLANGYVEEVA